MNYQPTLEFAQQLDAQDSLASFRDQFFFPLGPDKKQAIYLCGNSLGLQPKNVREFINIELDDWAKFGVEGHFEGRNPWFAYHEWFAEPVGAIVGALPHEVVVMNSLTTNLHILMASFYRPSAERFKIVIEASAFPSDQYAVASQAKYHGFDPSEAIVELGPREGEAVLRTEDIESYLAEHGHEVALVLFGGVNYYTGQAMEFERITKAGHAAGAMVGFDLAHAAGNLELKLHEWGPDFAAWCSYKYLNSSPGGVSGVFVHERHAESPELPRFAGWWGNDPSTRFEMGPEFYPQKGAAGWQLSNAPILTMAAHKASVSLFAEATMPELRKKSVAGTEYLLWLIDQIPTDSYEIITPRDPAARGGQISIRALGDGQALHAELTKAGVICDFRRPDVIRIGFAPIYNSFEDLWHFAQILRANS